jgi:nucleoside-diphosphate-sugar epimerase
MKRVLITGGSGFIGVQCIPLLVEAHYEVHATCSGRFPLPDIENVVFEAVNLLDPKSTADLVRRIKPSHLLHLAWITDPGRYWTAPENLDWMAASLGLTKVFQECGGKRVVLSGTCAEYDWSYGTCEEGRTPLRPQTLYGASKHGLQCATTAFAKQAGLSAAWARIFFTFGPGEHESKLVSSVARSLLNRETFRCSTPAEIRDFIYVVDAASALVALLDSDVTGPVNVGSGRGTTVRDIVLQAAATLGSMDRIVFDDPAQQSGALRVVADTGRLEKEVHWQAKVGLEAGVAATVGWWKKRVESLTT